MYIRINFEGRKFHKSKFFIIFVIYCECISGNFSYSRTKISQKYILLVPFAKICLSKFCMCMVLGQLSC